MTQTRRHSTLARTIAAALISAAVVLSPVPAPAQQRQVVVRDAEIERLLQDYARPILAAAGIKARTEIILINNNSFNAFVDGRRIFMNTGAIMSAETPNEIIGVLAHETGHLAGGHQEKLRQKLEAASTMATIAAVAGIGAAVAGSSTGNGEAAQVGMGVAMGSSEVARRSILAYQRSEEITADRSAVTYLNKSGQSVKGMLKTFKRFQSSLALSGTRVDPYQVSHPLPRERIANLETLAMESQFFDQVDPPALQARHDMARAKIAAYSGGANAVRRLFRNDPKGIGARYGDALVTYLNGSQKDALKKFDALVKEQPSNGYFQEIRGEILLKSNKPAEAVKAFRTALKMDPGKNSTIQVALGQALTLAGDPKAAVKELSEALRKDRSNGLGYEFLARAYGQMGQINEAELATAEMHFYNGNRNEAKIFAGRAQKGLKKGSPAWIRASDILKAGTKG
ncbi:MAG: M48 family metalloprotease [Rhizobiaceae bacterium]